MVVIPAKAGIQQNNTPRSAQKSCFLCASRDCSFYWIPAFAGMTGFRSNGQFGLNKVIRHTKPKPEAQIFFTLFEINATESSMPIF
jgi:hypothetical protein